MAGLVDSVLVTGGGGATGCGVSAVAVGAAVVVEEVGSWVLSLVTSVTGGAGAAGLTGAAASGMGVLGSAGEATVVAAETLAGSACLRACRRPRWAETAAARWAVVLEGCAVERTIAGGAA